MSNKINSESPAVYAVNVDNYHEDTNKQDEIIDTALFYLLSRLRQPGQVIDSPETTVKYLTLQLATCEHEVFSVLFMDNRHRVISFEHMFNGTIDGASVYAREVVKLALKLNAASVILSHNHPSGIPEPSQSDVKVTKRLVDALALVDVRVLDHIVIGGSEHVSFAERGLI